MFGFNACTAHFDVTAEFKQWKPRSVGKTSHHRRLTDNPGVIHQLLWLLTKVVSWTTRNTESKKATHTHTLLEPIFAPDTAFRVFRHSPSHDIKLKKISARIVQRTQLARTDRATSSLGRSPAIMENALFWQREQKFQREYRLTRDSYNTHTRQKLKNSSDLVWSNFIQILDQFFCERWFLGERQNLFTEGGHFC